MLLNLRAPAIKWITFHITVLKMVIGNESIIPGTCKWARTSEVLHYLPAIHHIILLVHEHMHVQGPVSQGLCLFNMNPLNPDLKKTAAAADDDDDDDPTESDSIKFHIPG